MKNHDNEMECFPNHSPRVTQSNKLCLSGYSVPHASPVCVEHLVLVELVNSPKSISVTMLVVAFSGAKRCTSSLAHNPVLPTKLLDAQLS